MNDLFTEGIHVKRLKHHALNLVWHLKEVKKAPDLNLDVTDTFERGYRAYEARYYDEAIHNFKKAISEGNRTGKDTELAYFYLSDSHFLLGESLPEGQEKRNHYQDQLRIAKKGRSFYPDHRELHKNLGLAYLKLGQLVRAEKEFNDLIARDPEYHFAKYNLACIYSVDDKLFACINVLSELFKKSERGRQWRKLARLDPDFDTLWTNELFQRTLYPSIPMFEI